MNRLKNPLIGAIIETLNPVNIWDSLHRSRGNNTDAIRTLIFRLLVLALLLIGAGATSAYFTSAIIPLVPCDKGLDNQLKVIVACQLSDAPAFLAKLVSSVMMCWLWTYFIIVVTGALDFNELANMFHTRQFKNSPELMAAIGWAAIFSFQYARVPYPALLNYVNQTMILSGKYILLSLVFITIFQKVCNVETLEDYVAGLRSDHSDMVALFTVFPLFLLIFVA